MRAEELAEIGIKALKEAKRIHDQLGEDGLTPVPSPNQFGEQALKADVYAERAVLDTLRKYQLPIRVISEEHGTTDITEKPSFLGILDGIDGTSRYKKGRGKLRYGTMFGISSNLNPRYKDYIFSGVMEHPTDKLWYATKNLGAFLKENGQDTLIKSSSQETIDSHTRVYTGENYNNLSRALFAGKFEDQWSKEPLSAAISYVDIASGFAELEAEVTRKQNLEQMIAYGLLREAGADMYSIDGKSLAGQIYLDFGQTESVAIFTAANPQLAKSFLKKLGLK